MPGPFGGITAELDSERRRVVAFVEPYGRVGEGRSADDYARTLSELRRALSAVRDCSGLPAGAVQLILVDRVVVRGVTYEPGESAGVVLIDGSKLPLSVDPGPGATRARSLVTSLAASYFDAPNCLPDEPTAPQETTTD